MKNILSIILFSLFFSCFANNAEEWFKKGNEAKRIEDQITFFKKALEADSNLTIAYKKLGYRYLKLKKYEEAIQYYSKSIELDPKNAKNIYRRGTCYFNLEKHKLAFSDFKSAVEINPELKNWYYYSYIENLIPSFKIKEVKFKTINTTEADSIRTVKSLIKNDNLYFMTYYNSYDNKTTKLEQEILSENWDFTETSDKNNIHCSIFTSSSPNPIHGRNMDNHPRTVLATLCHPKDGYSSISFTRMDFLGFGIEDDPTLFSIEKKLPLLDAPFWPADGMNECGLAISISSVAPSKIEIDRIKKPIFITHLIREILDHAKNVDEAISMIKKYNIYDNGKIISHHYLISDPSGRSVIAEYDKNEWKIIEKTKLWQVMANSPIYNISEETARQTCQRYKLLSDKLEDKNGNITWLDGMKFLKSVSYKGTQWSIIYDMTQKNIYASIQGNFELIQKIKLE